MTWTYTGPSASAKDAVRFHCQDTDSARQLLSDEEIAYLLARYEDTHGSDPVYVASIACKTIAAKVTGDVAVSADGVNVGLADLQARYLALAASLRADYLEQQGIVGPDLENAEGTDQVSPNVFGIGFHDNPMAGRQDYGDERASWPSVEENPGW